MRLKRMFIYLIHAYILKFYVSLKFNLFLYVFSLKSQFFSITLAFLRIKEFAFASLTQQLNPIKLHIVSSKSDM